MAIELGETEVAACTVYVGDDSTSLAVGESIKIETSPGGSELLNFACPAGKACEVTVFVRIEETTV